jgi:hypothetical protein
MRDETAHEWGTQSLVGFYVWGTRPSAHQNSLWMVQSSTLLFYSTT